MAGPSEAFKSQYAATVQLILQQEVSKFRDKVTVESLKGEFGLFTYVGKRTMQQKTVRHKKKNFVDADLFIRAIHSQPFHDEMLLDKDEEQRMMADPKSKFSESLQAGAKTYIDSLILAALRGTALTGKNASTPVALPASQKVLHGSDGFGVDKMKAALLKFTKADVPPEWPKHMAISPEDFDDLLDEVEYGSVEYNRLMPLMGGKVVPFLGFQLEVTNLLTVANNITYCVAWVPQCLTLAVTDEIKADAWVNKDYVGDPWAFDLYADMGASRMQEGGVVEVQTYRV